MTRLGLAVLTITMTGCAVTPKPSGDARVQSALLAARQQCEEEALRAFGKAAFDTADLDKLPEQLIGDITTLFNATTGVWLAEGLLGLDGRMHRVWQVQGVGAGADQEILNDVRRWRYEPSHVKGEAVPVCFTIRVELTPRRK